MKKLTIVETLIVMCVAWVFGLSAGLYIADRTFVIEDVERFTTYCVNNGDVETYTKSSSRVIIKCNDGAVFTLKGDEL